MSLTIAISPGGHLSVIEAADSVPVVADSTKKLLHSAFAESSASGLLLLASHSISEELPTAFVFWRGLTRQFFQAVCQLGEGGFDQWKEIPTPSHEQLDLLIADAPPMLGLEYLNVDVLKRLWVELRELVVERALSCSDGPASFLQTVNPLWHLLGRVTFHVAENKRDESRPFAFMATFTSRLSGQARLQHIPLAEALKLYAAANDREKLESLLEPVRRAAAKSPVVRELLDSKQLFAPQAWTIRQTYRFLTESVAMEEAGVVVRMPNWWSARQPPRPQVRVTIGGKASSTVGMKSLLDFEVDLAVDGEPLTDAERRQLMAGTEGLALLRGKWVEVNREKLAQALDHWEGLANAHAGGIDFIQGMRMLAGAKLATNDDVDEQVASWSRITSGDWLRETLNQLRDPSSITNCEPGRDLQATLRPYQSEGVRWLWFMTELGLGSCLADDMGLGKTIQVIDLLLQRKRHVALQARPASKKSKQPANQHAPSLLIVPASLIGNWREELKRFAPQLTVFIAHRSECDSETFEKIAKDPEKTLAGYDVVIATYSLTRSQNWLSNIHWSLLVLDEAQAIKNASSSQTKSVKKITAAGRIVLTGTPVENNLGDVWSLFDFCCPGLLGSAGEFKKFVKKLNQQQDSTAFGALRRLVRPYILRRMKTDPNIVPDLPEKTEMRTECGLSKKQAVLYENAVKDLARRLEETEEAEGIARKGLVLSMLMQFKQICNHPAQYLTGSAFTPAESGKFERLALLCEPIIARQEKMLVFTQFQSMTRPLAEYLATVFGREGLVLDGTTPVKKRAELVRTFQADDGPPFFVISLKAGGTGLNLTAASHVVHFDRWWNPAIENQATDRAFRIGQKRNVLVHKFVCRGTIEERIDTMIRDKQAVADQLLGEDTAPMLTEMSDDELLRFVALDIGKATADDL